MITALVTLPNIVALCTLLALTAYVTFGGADFGGGIWDGLASGPRQAAQRTLIAHTIGPIWEANQVWLVLVVVLLFTCFPAAFAAIMTVLHIPIALMLIGVVLRGSAFTFRAYDTSGDAAQQRWGRTFAMASVITPVLFGVCIGTIASGALRPTVPSMGAYAIYVAPWLAPFPIACGIFTLALFSFLAAVYLTVEAREPALQNDFRRRALWSTVAVFIAAFGTLLLAHREAPRLQTGVTATPWAPALHIATGLAAIIAIWALWTRRYRLARVAAPAQVALIMWGWGASQYPDILPGWMTIAGAAAPAITLRLTLIGLAGGTVILAPSLWYLFRLFSSAIPATE